MGVCGCPLKCRWNLQGDKRPREEGGGEFKERAASKIPNRDQSHPDPQVMPA